MFANTFGLWGLLKPTIELGMEDYAPKLEKWVSSFCSWKAVLTLF